MGLLETSAMIDLSLMTYVTLTHSLSSLGVIWVYLAFKQLSYLRISVLESGEHDCFNWLIAVEMERSGGFKGHFKGGGEVGLRV